MGFKGSKKINYKIGLLAIALGLIIHQFLPAGDVTDFFMGAFLSFGSIAVIISSWKKSTAPHNPA